MDVSLSCAIVDDDATFLRALRGYVLRACEEESISCQVEALSDPLDFIEDYEPRYDVVFLDIEMPQLNGMDLARQIRAQDERVCIIFITSMAQFALKGYEVNATDFIVKPLKYETFHTRFSHALRFVSLHRERDIVLRDDERTVRVPCSRVHYVEKSKNSAVYHTELGIFRCRSTVAKVMSELGGMPFVQVNSGIIVNLAHVTTYTATEIVLGDHSVPLSRSRRAGFMRAFMDYLGG